MSDWQGDITEVLARLQGMAADERAQILDELRRSNAPLHSEVVAELRLMRAAQEAMPTPVPVSPHVPDEKDALIGQDVDGNPIERRIGLGGMGSVYRAEPIRSSKPLRSRCSIRSSRPRSSGGALPSSNRRWPLWTILQSLRFMMQENLAAIRIL